jgi:hypothetical protein
MPAPEIVVVMRVCSRFLPGVKGRPAGSVETKTSHAFSQMVGTQVQSRFLDGRCLGYSVIAGLESPDRQ